MNFDINKIIDETNDTAIICNYKHEAMQLFNWIWKNYYKHHSPKVYKNFMRISDYGNPEHLSDSIAYYFSTDQILKTPASFAITNSAKHTVYTCDEVLLPNKDQLFVLAQTN
jgi:hypothetical protein